jgi:SAM-dependent methyltransferase
LKRVPFVTLVSVLLFVAFVSFVPLVSLLNHAAERSVRVEYSDLPAALRHRWSTPAEFAAYVRGVETDTDRRVAEGEREHVIYYALQSATFTTRPRIEPAISGLAFVGKLSQPERSRLVEDPSYLPNAGWPPAERARVADLLNALRKGPVDARLAYFRELLSGRDAASVESLYPDYVRVARFLYRKEFLSGGDAATVSQLYQSRAHSSDTQIDAGFGVYLGLGTARALEPALRMTSVLVVGPGLDLAPRTDLIEVVAPQSYQPFAVADALVALSLASERDLRIHSIDVNPRVVRFIEAVAREPITLHVFTGMAETTEQPFSADYRTYVRQLGRAIGDEVAPPRAIASDRRYQHSIAVRPSFARAMSAERLNIVSERLVERGAFDLIVATNVLNYFDDRQLALALSNIAAMLRPGGLLLHNESRAGLVETADAVGLPPLQMRTAVIGGPAERPLYDAVWLHRKVRTP